MPNSINYQKALQRIRASLYFAAALALKHDVDLASEVSRILCEPQPKKQNLNDPVIVEKHTILSPREMLVFNTICKESEPISINELLDKFKVNKETRCSRATLTTVIKVLKKLDLIYYTVIENNKSGYLKKEKSSCFR